MCIAITGRRRSSLNLSNLSSEILSTSSAAVSSHATADASSEAPPSELLSLSPLEGLETQLTSTSTPAAKPAKKSRKSKKSSTNSKPHYLPHHDGVPTNHQYHDHATDPIVDPSLIKYKAKGGVVTPFPVKLHDMLDRIETDGLTNVISWQPHGRCFVVHDPKEFVNHVMPHYFKQTKMASFHRQLNLYGFNRLTGGGLDRGGYYHEMFLRGKVSLAYDIHRMRVKGTGVRMPTNPDNEPNFYALPHVVANSDVLPTALPSLPQPEISMADDTVLDDMNERRAKLLRESHDHSLKIAQAKKRQRQRVESDVVFFEGLPFHYLGPLALQSLPAPKQPDERPALVLSSPIDVSESDSNHSDNDRDNVFLPSVSASDMDWSRPVSIPTIQAHMRRSSVQSFAKDRAFIESGPLKEDIDLFFRGFEMPVDSYHEQIEHMDDGDDAAFGYLLEQAITE